MTIGLVGKKCGMTRVFTDDGVSIPDTVIEVLPNRVTQVKTVDNDGYMAIQVATGVRKRSRVSKAQAGHFAKAGVEPSDELCEFRVEDEKQLEGIVQVQQTDNCAYGSSPGADRVRLRKVCRPVKFSSDLMHLCITGR